jgi:hypothetical protein
MLVTAVVALFVSACVPMPKSVLHNSHTVAAVTVPAAQAFGAALSATSWRPQLMPSNELAASGTELINRLCSRIC